MLLDVHHVLALRRRRGLSLRTDSVLVLQRLMLVVRTRERSLRWLHHDLVTREVVLHWLVGVAHLLLHHASHLARVGRGAPERLTCRLLIVHRGTRL